MINNEILTISPSTKLIAKQMAKPFSRVLHDNPEVYERSKLDQEFQSNEQSSRKRLKKTIRFACRALTDEQKIHQKI